MQLIHLAAPMIAQQPLVAGAVGGWLAQHGPQLLWRAFLVVLLVLAGGAVIRRVDRVVRKFLRDSPKVNALLENFLGHVVSKVLWTVLVLMILQTVAVDVGPLLAGLGVTGFIIGFAFQDTLANLASGMMIALNSPFQVGDYVEISGVGGAVKDVNMMAVTMLSPDNKRIVIPNKQVWGNTILNYTAMDTRRLDATMSVSYGADIAKAREVLRSVVAAQPACLADPPPTIEVMSMGDSAVNFVVRPWVKTTDYWTTMFALNQAMKEPLDRAGIEIPFPQLDVHVAEKPKAAPATGSAP